MPRSDEVTNGLMDDVSMLPSALAVMLKARRTPQIAA